MTEQIGIEDYHASERISSSKLRTFMALGPRAYYLRHAEEQRPQAVQAHDCGSGF